MYTTLNNQQIYYQKLGTGKDLILLHGWKQDVSSFHSISEILKQHFTLWLIDLPGFGRSETPKKPFYVKDYAEIIADFIKENKLEKPNLLGHSLGGRVGIKLASEKPEILNKLVLESSAGIKHEHDLLRLAGFAMAKIFNLLIPESLTFKKYLKHKFYKQVGSDYDDVKELKSTFINIINEDLTPDLPKIKNPTLVIGGEFDTAVPPRDQKKMYRKIPNSKLEILDKVSHFPHLENPSKFLYYVIDFLSPSSSQRRLGSN